MMAVVAAVEAPVWSHKPGCCILAAGWRPGRLMRRGPPRAGRDQGNPHIPELGTAPGASTAAQRHYPPVQKLEKLGKMTALGKMPTALGKMTALTRRLGLVVVVRIPLCCPVLLQQPLQQRRLLPSRLAHLGRVAAKRVHPCRLLCRRRSSSSIRRVVGIAGCWGGSAARCGPAGAGGGAPAGPPGGAVEGAPQLLAQVLHLPLAGEEDEDAAGRQGAVDLADLRGAGARVGDQTCGSNTRSSERRSQVAQARARGM